MASLAELLILIRARDEASGTIDKVTKQTVQLDRAFQSVGRQAVLMGAGIVAAFGLAVKAYAEHDQKMAATLNNVKNSFNQLRISVGQAVAPLVTYLAELLNKTIAWLQAHPALLAAVSNLGLTFGILLSVVGPILILLPSLIAGFKLLAAFFIGSLIPAISATAVAAWNAVVALVAMLAASGPAGWAMLAGFGVALAGALTSVVMIGKDVISSFSAQNTAIQETSNSYSSLAIAADRVAESQKKITFAQEQNILSLKRLNQETERYMALMNAITESSSNLAWQKAWAGKELYMTENIYPSAFGGGGGIPTKGMIPIEGLPGPITIRVDLANPYGEYVVDSAGNVVRKREEVE